MIARGKGRSLLAAIMLFGDHRKNKSISVLEKSVFCFVFLHRTEKYQLLGFTACVDVESQCLFIWHEKSLNEDLQLFLP